MPNTVERREITRRVNAQEADIIQQSKKLVSTTEAVLRKDVHEHFSAEHSSNQSGISQRAEYGLTQVATSDGGGLHETEEHRRDEEASSQMVNEGGPG